MTRTLRARRTAALLLALPVAPVPVPVRVLALFLLPPLLEPPMPTQVRVSRQDGPGLRVQGSAGSDGEP